MSAISAEPDRSLGASIVDSADDAIISRDCEGIITSWNLAAEQMFGYASAEIIGQPMTLLLAQERQHEESDFLHRLNLGQRIRGLETVRVQKSGARLRVSVTISPIRDQGGRMIGASEIIREISQREEFEGALAQTEQQPRVEQGFRESEAGYRTITEAMPHLVWSTRPDGVLTYINRKWTEYTGQELTGAAPGPWLDAVHPDDATRVAELWQDALRSETEFNCDYRLKSRDGTFRWFKSWGIPLRDAQGQVINWFGACTDVDETIKAREILSHAHDELERTVQERTARLQEIIAELETLSYSIAHDMRAPLRAMQGFAEAVLDDYGHQIDPEGKDYLERIKNAAARQDHFIRDVLNYSRLVRQELVLQPTDLDAVLEGVIAEYPDLLQARDSIEVRSPLGLALAHPPSLVQCLSNLLGNALKFVAPGTQPQVRVWSESRGGKLRLWIQDNGIGIAPEHHTRIFRLFDRLHGQELYSGTGMGLAVVRKATERMEGQVGVESNLGEGSRFWLELKRPAS